MIYNLIEPVSAKVPIILSVPHSGILFPKERTEDYKEKALLSPDDADWFVDQLYDFAPSMGITMISAKYHRWLIDLNRNSESKPLYGDGRVITGLTPTTDFNGNTIYNTGKEPTEQEVKSRLINYYHPYYQKINDLLMGLQTEFKHVLFYDAHSIRQYVPGVHAEKFPDLILGDVDQTSASSVIIDAAKDILADSKYSFANNYPFKGGNLTRHFGKPDQNQHALQLEMSKLVYMDDEEIKYHPKRAQEIRNLLMNMFTNLITKLNELNCH